MSIITPLETFGIIETASGATPLYLVDHAAWDNWIEQASSGEESWATAHGFTGPGLMPKLGTVLVLPNADGGIDKAIGVIGDAPIWHAASIAARLPAGNWEITDFTGTDAQLEQVLIGWGLSNYHFDAYRNDPPNRTVSAVVLPPQIDQDRIAGLVQGTALCRDLINTPPNHMTPQGLEDAAKDMAWHHGAKVTVISGKKLISGFPAINTVGRAAEIAPRLIDLSWGKTGPKITLIGKGITFDSGGLDIKPSKAMEMMKKDMGGAAIVLGLANALMTAGIQIQLRVLIPAAENAVSDRAMRPLDVIDTRAGLRVEVGNTDAEGRLVLADALTLALEDDPEFIIDFATLTGAARVALGTELPALFCNDDDTANGIIAAGLDARDPLWRLPLFDDYERHLDGGYITLSSTGLSGYGGAITAALFLRRFAGADTNWAHVDVMAWNLGGRPGRPKGGEAMGLRALFGYISALQ